MRQAWGCAIHANSTSLHSLRDSQSPIDILAVDCAVEAVLGVDGFRNSFLFGLESVDRNDRPEDLFLHRSRGLWEVREDGRLDEEAITTFVLEFAAPLEELAATLLNFLEVLQHPLELDFIGLRTLCSLRIKRVARLELLECFSEGLAEPVGNSVLHVDSRVGNASLPTDEADRERGFGGGLLNLGVFEDDGWRLAAELEDDPLKVRLRGHLLDLLASHGGAGEVDDADVRMKGQRAASWSAVTGEEVDSAWWEADLLAELGHLEGLLVFILTANL